MKVPLYGSIWGSGLRALSSRFEGCGFRIWGLGGWV